MQLRNRAEVFRSCRRRSHGDGWGESLCLCCSRDFSGGVWNAPQSEMRRGDRQRIPRDESPRTRLFARGTEGSNPSLSSKESIANLMPTTLQRGQGTRSARGLLRSMPNGPRRNAPGGHNIRPAGARSGSVYLSPSRPHLGCRGMNMSPNMRIVSVICCAALLALNASSLFAAASQFYSYFAGASLAVALALLVVMLINPGKAPEPE